MVLTRQIKVEGLLEPPVHHGRIVELGEHGGAKRSVPVMFHLSQNGCFGNFLPENQAGLMGLRLNSTAILDSETSVGKAIVRIGERDLIGSRFPFSILEVLDRPET
jgi:hypothetical protein